MQCYKTKTRDKIKIQDAQAAIRQGKTCYREPPLSVPTLKILATQSRLKMKSKLKMCKRPGQDLQPGTTSFSVPITLKILALPVLHRDQSATISCDARFQLDGFRQEVDEIIDANAAASGVGEGSDGNEVRWSQPEIQLATTLNWLQPGPIA
ncbi:hypothetical protein C8J57DRAFT_1237092 [Mycena rebaudengoi]|nr:hypothetical protein C8J57DRAFT_1237092 [Mycena rebaudengoi]